MLVKVAEIIKETIRETDIAGRYGGEEFLVILPGARGEHALRSAERIRQAIEKTNFAEGVALTISGGVKEYTGEELTEHIHRADLALYKAKRSGRNQIVQYENDSMNV